MAPPLTLSVATKLISASLCKSESMTTVGTPLRLASSTGPRMAMLSTGASTIPSTPRTNHVFYNINLGCAIVTPYRSLPDDVHAQFATGFDGAGMHHFPIFIGGVAIGHHRDSQFFCTAIFAPTAIHMVACAAAACCRRNQQGAKNGRRKFSKNGHGCKSFLIRQGESGRTQCTGVMVSRAITASPGPLDFCATVVQSRPGSFCLWPPGVFV